MIGVFQRRVGIVMMVALWCLSWGVMTAGFADPPSGTPAGEKPQHYAQLWVDDTAIVTPQALKQTLADLATQGSDFTHVLVMTHGFDLDEASSTRQLDALAARFKHEFKTKGSQKLGIVCLQWHSATGATLMPLTGDYLRKVALARSVGHGPARQLLFALQGKYPKANLSFVGHSLGCELMAAALTPEITYDGTLPFVPTFEPKRELKILLQAYIGSDSNYNLYQMGQVSAAQTIGRAKLFWQTMVPLQPELRDKVLVMKAHLFSRPLGSRYPGLAVEQLDAAVSGRRWVCDSKDIPHGHNFVDYFTDARVAALSDAMKFLANPKAPKPSLLVTLDKVLAAPADAEVLARYLDDEDAGVTFYALWRLEKLLCKNSVHLTDETYDKTIETLRSYPKQLWRTQKDSPCETIRRGIFPTKAMMTRAGAPDRSRPDKWR